MRTYQLRTYYLNSEKAVADYLPRWRPHIESLRLFGVETHGFFSVPSDPRVVVTLLSYDPTADPDTVVREYMKSSGFQGDMAGFDLSQIEKVETLILKPAYGSPLT